MKMPIPLKLACLAVFAALALCATDFRLSDKSKIGSAVLPAGAYSLSVRGSLAIIKDEQSGKSVTTVVKSQTGSTKFHETMVHITKANGEARVSSIEVGGSDTTLVFE